MKLFDRRTNTEVKRGEKIKSGNGVEYVFLMCIPGRVSNKIYVGMIDPKNPLKTSGQGREFFETVFPGYEVRQDEPQG